ncbi:hypothetical protein [Sphingomonas montanisoli]|nr:hypothetical protein [Sphingomonas montanisoli]
MHLPDDSPPPAPQRRPSTLFEMLMGMTPEEWDAIAAVEREAGDE